MIYLFTFLHIEHSRLNEPGAYSTAMGTLQGMARYLAANDQEVLVHSIKLTDEVENMLAAAEFSMLP